MRKFQKISIVLLVLAMLVSGFVACGSTPKDPDNGGDNNGGTGGDTLAAPGVPTAVLDVETAGSLKVVITAPTDGGAVEKYLVGYHTSDIADKAAFDALDAAKKAEVAGDADPLEHTFSSVTAGAVHVIVFAVNATGETKIADCVQGTVK